jgi:hypothetical protein
LLAQFGGLPVAKELYHPREASPFWVEVVISKGDGLAYRLS